MNGIQSGSGSGISPNSCVESGQKYHETTGAKDIKTNNDKLNGVKNSGGSSGISGHDNNDSGDNPTSTNNIPNQKQRDETKGSGSREGSKTVTNNTNGSNT